MIGALGAQRFRERAAHLRRLASTERDIKVRQELGAMAVRFEQFADELECQDFSRQEPAP